MCDIKMKPQAEKKSQSRLMRPLIRIIVVAVLVLVVAAFIVHLFSPQIPSLITADGMLSYIGSGISSVATILLAVIAYKQTERANQMADKLAQQSNLFAEQANELSKQANNAAKKANDLAEESYKVAQKSNDLAAQSNEAAKQSNKLAELSLQATQQANKLTKQANEMSERVLKLEEEQSKVEIRPFFLVTDWEVCKGIPAEFEDKRRTIAYQVGSDNAGSRVALILELTNTTQSYEVFRYHGAMSSSGERWKICVSNRNGTSLGIPAEESRRVCFYAGSSFFSGIEGKTLNFEFILENRFGERYKESFDVVVIRCDWDRKDCNISPQKYEIQAFTKDCGLVPG